MRVRKTAILGAYVVEPVHHRDERGAFHESMRTDVLEEVLGEPFVIRQVSYSESRRNVLRGVHVVAHLPGQTRYVTCVRGALRDIIVDLRTDSPTFGRHVVTELEAGSGRALYIPDGLGHGFLTLRDDTCISYLMSTVYEPGTLIDINPLDPELGLPWGLTEPPLMSEKDRHAPGLLDVLATGRLTRRSPAPPGPGVP